MGIGTTDGSRTHNELNQLEDLTLGIIIRKRSNPRLNAVQTSDDILQGKGGRATRGWVLSHAAAERPH